MQKSGQAKVAVLLGGRSAEREVSLASGKACAEALRSKGYDVVEIDVAENMIETLQAEKPDVVFNALHGRFGEDGVVQGVLEWLQIPYTHSGVRASSLAMDKELTKAVYRANGLPVAESILVSRDSLRAKDTKHPMPVPYVIKPYDEGSSVGVYIVPEGANRVPDIDPNMPQTLMVEAYLKGRELTTAVMDDKAQTVTEIITSGWYDYDAKYAPGGSRHECPADLPKEIFALCLDYAERAHKALGCRGMSRTDFRWDEEKGVDGLFLLETNTQPGMTATSLAPEQAAAMGMSFPDLCDWMVKDASCTR